MVQREQSLFIGATLKRDAAISTCKLAVQYTVIEHSECTEIHRQLHRLTQTYARIVNTLIEHSNNKIIFYINVVHIGA